VKKKADIKRILLIGIPMLLLAIGVKLLDDEGRILWFERNGTEYTRARFYLFSGEKDRAFRVEPGNDIVIEWVPELEKGNLQLSVKRPSDSPPMFTEKKDTFEFTAEEKGQVKLKVTGEDARGKFEVRWTKE